MVTQLLEAIADVEMWNYKYTGLQDHIVILAPRDTLAALWAEEVGEGHPDGRLTQCASQDNSLPRFNGLLVIEDESLTQIVVRSLISDHRVVVHL